MANFENSTVRGFAMHDKNGITYMTVPAVDACGHFHHGFMTRRGGVSSGVYASLNLSMTREGNPQNRKENYRLACEALGIDPEDLVLVNYEHGDGICEITPADRGKGFDIPTDLPKCDALVVEGPGVTAVTMHADCTPVFCVDRTGSRGGICHSGWKGTVRRLPQKLAAYLIKKGSRPEDLLIGIGPHIRSCCFEVGEEVAEIFREEFGEQTIQERRGEKSWISLENALLAQLAALGLDPGQITVAEECTSCREDLFYSHRRDHGNTGAMGAFLAIR